MRLASLSMICMLWKPRKMSRLKERCFLRMLARETLEEIFCCASTEIWLPDISICNMRLVMEALFVSLPGDAEESSNENKGLENHNPTVGIAH